MPERNRECSYPRLDFNCESESPTKEAHYDKKLTYSHRDSRPSNPTPTGRKWIELKAIHKRLYPDATISREVDDALLDLARKFATESPFK